MINFLNEETPVNYIELRHHAVGMSSSSVVGRFDYYDGTFIGTVRLGGGHHMSASEGQDLGKVTMAVPELADLMTRQSREWQAFGASSAGFAERFGIGLTVDRSILRRRIEDALRKWADLETLFEIAERLQVRTS